MSPSTSLRVLCGLTAALTAVSAVSAESLGAASSFMSLYGLGAPALVFLTALSLVPGTKAAPVKVADFWPVKRGGEVADFWPIKRGDGLQERGGEVADFWPVERGDELQKRGGPVADFWKTT
ncbi:hypothetical protein BC835DRAFT_1413363 [Cytidiella melzeri]|nr:hypothetical protein BC835DRAFT_1413363 [Cytidiella melzeri]